MNFVKIVAACALPALLLASAPAVGAEDTPRLPRGDRLVLQASTGGGYVSSDVARNEMPELTITRDGRVITLGPTTLQYPPNALPNLQVGRISPKRVRALVKSAGELGLLDDEQPDYGQPQVTDNPTTTVTVLADGERVTTSVYALGFDADGLSDEQRANRAALTTFLAQAAGTRTTRAYEYDRLAVLVRERSTDDLQETEIDWPLGDLGEAIPAGDGSGEGCLVAAGEDLATVIDAARDASTLTPWVSGGRRYDLAFRPLLPNERTCVDAT
jgi:hypothetical protein